MKATEKNKLKRLITKYNPILRISIEIALVEDLFNLIIVNGDDKNFELKDMLLEKEQLKEYVMKEFIKLNNKPITSELRNMEEIQLNLFNFKNRKKE
jgi:hypothetical protein